MTDPQSAPNRPRTPKYVRAALFVSLALNLAVIGLVAGFIWRGGPDGGPPRHVRDVVAPYTAALDKSARRAIGRRIFRDLRQEGSRDDLRARIRAEYAEALTLLRQDPFDPAAFADLLDRQYRRAAQLQQRGQAELVAYVAGMDAQQRQEYAARVSDALKKYGRSRR